jgi:exonuclease SbcD
MRVAHIADAHLGYRAYSKLNPAGFNAREVDVLDAFRQALEKVAEIKPDLILIAGDLFHAVRPSNLAIGYAFRQLVRLRSAIRSPVVIIAGNHDSPRSRDTGCILDLLSNIPDVHVVHAEPKQLRFPELDTCVFCLPHAGLPFLSSLRIVPEPDCTYNILIAHARTEGEKKGFDQYEITRDDVRPEEWDYVAYGHLHSFKEVAPNAFHPGSLEYAGGLTIWEQLDECSKRGVGKGFIEYDLDQKRLVAFHAVQPREAVNLRPIDAAEFTLSEVNDVIRQRVSGVPGGAKGKIIRLVIENVDLPTRAQIDYSVLRQIRSDALHFELDLRKPAVPDGQASDPSKGPARPLELEWEDLAHRLVLPSSVDRERLTLLGRQYLASAIRVEEA